LRYSHVSACLKNYSMEGCAQLINVEREGEETCLDVKLAACAEEGGQVVEGADAYAEALWPIFFLDVDIVVSEDVGIYSVLGVVGGERNAGYGGS